MSTTDIYGFRKSDSCAELCASIPNAWRGAMAIWSALEERYLPPYIPDSIKFCNWYRPGMSIEEITLKNGYKPTRCTTVTLRPEDSPIREVWDLVYSPSLSKEDRVALYSTFDHALVRAEYAPKVIAAFRACTLPHTNLKEQADAMEELLQSGEYIAFGWGSSLSAMQWDAILQVRSGESVPYNSETGTNHWWITDVAVCHLPFGEVPQIGDLYFHHTYVFYEEPQVFSCLDASGGKLYFMAAIPSVGEKQAWLAVPISEERLQLAEANKVDMRSLLLRPESKVFRVEKSGDEFAAEEIQPNSLTNDMLPREGAYLDYNGEKE